MTVQIVEQEVRRSANRIEEAADSADGVSFKDDLATVAAALPGGQSGPAATALATDIDADLDAWATAAHGHHTSTNAAAGDITEADIQVRHHFTGGRQAI